MLPPDLPSVTQGAIAHSASGSMTSQFHSSSPPPTSGPMAKETCLRPRHSGQKNKMIPPPLPSLPFFGPNELPGPGAGSMTEKLPTSFSSLDASQEKGQTRFPSSQSTRGIGGHAAQLQKTGETLMAPTRRKKADNLNISNSEENPMAPSQLKRCKEKVAHSKDFSRPSDRFGFKLSQSQATHPVGHNHKETGSDVAEQDLENHSGSGDLDDFDEWGKSANEHETQDERRAADDDFGEYDNGPALTDSPPGDTIPYDVLQHHQAKNGRRKAPSLTCLSSNSHGHTLTSNTFGRSKSPRQYSPKHIPRCWSPETRTSSTHLKPPQRAPRKGPSAKAGSAHGGRDPTSRLRVQAGVVIPHPVHLVNAPKLGQRLSLLTQGLRVQAGVVITLSAGPSPSQYSPAQSTTIFTRSRSPHRSTSHGSSPGHSSLRPPDRRASRFNHSQSHTPVPSCSHSHTRSPTPESRNRDKPMNKQTNPSKLGFYPPCWQAFLQAAKLEMRLQAVLTHPVPEHQHALQLAREVLDAVLWSYHSKKIKMENGHRCRALSEDPDLRSDPDLMDISVVRSTDPI
ncbi:hypothetical protein DFJ58DRAFT_738551 [Suillus subalutaceus]|uniref:uncharacterized protein n=1 Tax=Suillus subalutaceus TaxID=48586 RepID=UPI001B878324|nr:uncharacterized protein DFJ58DRAFT_738551 [Suillus subalutaceus]KAG1825233.1 hypothetical protein DFJ58DRAFT_738551 [Suillus subalutaceus]